MLIGSDQVAEITSRWHAIGVLRGDLVDPKAVFLIAELDGRLVGHALGRIDDTGQAALKRLYVLPECQRHGVGSALLEAIQSHIGPEMPMELEVERQNAKAIAFYAGHGFVEIGTTAHCGADSNIPAIIMRRAVTP